MSILHVGVTSLAPLWHKDILHMYVYSRLKKEKTPYKVLIPIEEILSTMIIR